MAAWEAETDKSWQEFLQKMLPAAGSPFPDEEPRLDYSMNLSNSNPIPQDDEEHLDYSLEFHRPPVPYAVPVKFESVSDCPPKVSWSIRSRNGDSADNPMKELRSPTIIQSRRTRTLSPSRTLFEILYSGDESEEVESIDLETLRAPILTFNMEMDYDGEVSSSRSNFSLTDSEASTIVVKKKVKWLMCRTGGVCRRCGNRSRLREREACIVCNAKYCSNCVIRAMGSMPEGRKCIVCIGFRINESNRSSLGKCSRLLRKVCSSLQVRQIMKAEMELPVNQPRSNQLFVNRRQLREQELAEILGSRNPPQKLKPGRYWYDKDSGYWGKDGEKPNRIITSNLNVGGKLRTDASNGNTKVYINSREITTTELGLLKLTNVQCSKDTHIVLYDDGSYQEEGQNNIQGNIWRKAGIRFFCSLLSLPMPPTNPPVLPKDDDLDHGKAYKILLIGLEGSGSSTIFKQGKFMNGKRFNRQELHNIKLMIQSNIYKYLRVILEGRERFEEEALAKQKSAALNAKNSGERNEPSTCVYSIKPRLKHYSDWFLDLMAKGDMDMFFLAATREYAPIVEEIWKNSAIQETYKRRRELHNLPNVAKYFLNRAVEISNNEYEPSEKDMLLAEGVTPSHGISSFEFSFDDVSPMSSQVTNQNFERYQLIHTDSKGLKNGYCKRLQMLEDMQVIVFCVDLSEYDSDKMLASRDLFVSLVKQPCFSNKPFVLLLNKYDAFEEKANRVPIAVCDWFKEFNPLNKSRNKNINIKKANQEYYYVAVKFKKLYGSLTGNKKLFVWKTQGRERKSVYEAFKFVREVVKWEEEKEQNSYGLFI